MVALGLIRVACRQNRAIIGSDARLTASVGILWLARMPDWQPLLMVMHTSKSNKRLKSKPSTSIWSVLSAQVLTSLAF